MKEYEQGPASSIVLDVRQLQCSQAVMALLRQLVHTPPGGLIEVWWEEPDAHRDMVTVLKRQGHLILQEWATDEHHCLLLAKGEG